MENKLIYMKEREEVFTPLLAIEEASRCLLCHDAPCTKACPAGTDPGKFIRSLRFRNFKGSVTTIRENNILGGVCARVCPTDKYCEGACSRCGIDKPIQIGKLQRYLTDYEQSIGIEALEAIKATKEKVAIIGSGPSGLAAAAELALEGYKITVFEARNQLGGWLTYGIPEDRLPQSVVKNEIGYIKNLGVHFRTNCKVGRDVNIDDLRKEGFEAFLVAVGMQKSKDIEIKGNDLEGVIAGTDFLAEVKTSKGKVKVGSKVIVIGGGDVAMDCAVTAKLLGAEDVKIVYRRTIEKMPADRKEIAYTQDLNIPIFTGLKPAEIIGQAGKVARFKATGMFDDSELNLPVDRIIFAIGQEAEEIKELKEAVKEVAATKEVTTVEFNEKGTIETIDYSTNIEGIFASGDIIEGDKTVVNAVKEGKEAAKAIVKYLLAKKEGVR
ncbi:FAD-binding protein [Clostridium sporogenes]|uniref:FAD-dependent oxidoreductase n=1 Tax=Clostridium sporogenes TaxID=1509 RepID=UPI00196A00B5|nr:FAD-dependent oxidoreductase [Clostridium sporogenes]EJE7233389.1 FAD-dependent oxidoreductase [Clostridium botulinum]NFE81624.1 FAD-binding protein [Clostridium sporogenes]NFG68651.1 FAD-binding protein [Clostridium sporogenes]